MKLCYAFRRGTFYPFIAGAAWNIPEDPKTRTEYLGKVNDMGFDGIELGFEAFGGFEATKEKQRSSSRSSPMPVRPASRSERVGDWRSPTWPLRTASVLRRP